MLVVLVGLMLLVDWYLGISSRSDVKSPEKNISQSFIERSLYGYALSKQSLIDFELHQEDSLFDF